MSVTNYYQALLIVQERLLLHGPQSTWIYTVQVKKYLHCNESGQKCLGNKYVEYCMVLISCMKLNMLI